MKVESLSFARTTDGEPESGGSCAPDVVDAPAIQAGAITAPAKERVRDKAFTATDSPCVAICSTLFDDICRGCGRTAMEVSNWVFMTEDEKKVVWTRILAQGYPRR